MYILFLGLLHNAADNVCTEINTQFSGIQAQVIVLGLTPGPAGVVLIVDPAALIFLVQTGLRALVGFAVLLYDPLGTEGDIGMGVDMEGIFAVFENVVRIPADDDAGTLISQLQDDAALNVPQEVGGGQAVHDAGNTLGGKGIGEQALAGGVLAVLFDELGGEAGFQGNLIHQFLVVEGNTQLFSHLAANGASAGTKLTADGDDLLFHRKASSEIILYHIIDKFCTNVNSHALGWKRKDGEGMPLRH